MDKIVEIINHHSLRRWLQSYFGIQRVQIYRIGVASERYKASGFILSRESAILLFYGIISNSINLKSSITNERNIK